jgi:cyclohexanone monooxygenase
VLRHITRMDDEHLAWIDVKPEAMAVYNRTLQSELEAVVVWNSGACRDYYRHPSGRIVTQWPHSMGRYRDATSAADEAAYEAG